MKKYPGILGYSDIHSTIPRWSVGRGDVWKSILVILGYSDTHTLLSQDGLSMGAMKKYPSNPGIL